MSNVSAHLFMKYGIVVISCIATMLPLFVGAHAIGESLEKSVDGYVVDIGYNVTEFVADTPVVFEFTLLDTDETLVDYSNVWLRIVKDGTTILATGVYNAEFGGARTTYAFPEPGAYELSARYEDGTNSIAEAVFAIEVMPNPNKNQKGADAVVVLIAVLVGGCIGAVGARLFK